MSLAVGISCRDGRAAKHPIISLTTIIQIIRKAIYHSIFHFIFTIFPLNQLLSYQMNLTLSNQYKSQKPHAFIQLCLPTRSNDKALAADRQQCSGLFNCCMNGHGHLASHQPENAQLQLRKMGQPANQSTPKRTCSEQKKQKISVSLNHKSTQHCTPDRKKISRTPKHQSEQAKAKTEQATHSRIQLTPKSHKTKTEPKKDSKHKDESIHHIRSSTKPFQCSLSSKRQTDTRSKLTLSSAFKSQLRQQKKPMQTIPQQFSSDHLLIQDSFMTAKLANIYGDRNSELELFPKSNIVFYNQLMTNQQIWKANPPAHHDVTFSYNEAKVDYRDVSIQKDIPEEGSEREEEELAFKARTRERKWIGEYAKTIKTFNESQMRSNQLNSEAESIVLQKGHNPFTNHLFPITPINRGSIKQYKEQPSITRGYSSLKEEQPVNMTQGEHRFKKFVSQTIEEDLHDSQNNFSVRE